MWSCFIMLRAHFIFNGGGGKRLSHYWLATLTGQIRLGPGGMDWILWADSEAKTMQDS